jgi:hypothetical protein
LDRSDDGGDMVSSGSLSVGVLLLRDIRRVFDKACADKLPTIQLLAGLARLDEAPWATMRKGEPLDARGLADVLGDYGIASKSLRDDHGHKFRGYASSQFVDAWERYPAPVDDDDETLGDDDGLAA